MQVVKKFDPPGWPYSGKLLHSSRETRHHTVEVGKGSPLVENGGDAHIDNKCSGEKECAYVVLLMDDSYLTGMSVCMCVCVCVCACV